MTKGALVSVKYRDDPSMLGVVLDYRPDVLGGSEAITVSLAGLGRKVKILNHEKRGEVLIMCYADGSYSWYDEIAVSLVV